MLHNADNIMLYSIHYTVLLNHTFVLYNVYHRYYVQWNYFVRYNTKLTILYLSKEQFG